MPLGLEVRASSRTRGDAPDAGVCGNRTNKTNRAKLPGGKLGPWRRRSDHGPDLNRGLAPAQTSKCGRSTLSVPVFEALLLQRVRAFLQNLPRRIFRLKRPRKFLALETVEEMKSGHEPVVALISMLAHKNTDGITLKLYDISVRHEISSSR